MFGRVCMGWMADRLSGTMTLAMAAIGSAVATALLALSTAAWPLWAFMLLAAFSGVVIGLERCPDRRDRAALAARTDRRDRGRRRSCSSSSPTSSRRWPSPHLSLLTGRYDIAFLVSAAFSLICLPLLWGSIGARRRVAERAAMAALPNRRIG